jgi:formylglycine-generating enzyme required for sulfatase activity
MAVGILACSLLAAAAGADDSLLHPLAKDLAKQAAASRLPRLAVEPFTDLEGRMTPVGRLLAAELTVELAVYRSIQMMDHRQLTAHLDRRAVSSLSGLPKAQLAKIGQELEIDAVVAGTIVESGSQVRLTVRLIAVKNSRLAGSVRRKLPKSGLFAEPTEPSAPLPPPPAMSESSHARSPQSRPPEDMVLVPAGSFLFGDDAQRRSATLPAFLIDLFEVTNARYAGFRDHEYDPLASHRPVVNVSWNQARQFCLSQGRRLPTEEEWEKAARGTDGRLYPWGNDYDPARANAGQRFPGPTNTGAFEEGRSPYGLYDMAGNVAEWTESSDGDVKVYRGGSWASAPEGVRVTSRGIIAPAHRLPDLGFRCAMDGPR